MSTAPVLRLSRALLPPLAYVKHDGAKRPGIVYIGGFMSNMTGPKALAVEKLAVARGHPFVRFDYTDLGESTSVDAEKLFSFEQWRQDVLNVLDQLTDGPQILVGSSMGGWLSLLTALEIPDRVAGIVTISLACGFFPRFAQDLDADGRQRVNRGETVWLKSLSHSTPINSRMLTESAPFDLLHQTSIPITCPVRCVHCLQDHLATYQNMLELVSKIESPDVEIVMKRAGDHQMNDDGSIVLLTDSIVHLLERNPCY